ncbi:uncharacterized protein LOC126631861 isoform X1 [Malus sylvestris]|uniref:uncharacterized protein LOC126631861 isoform X1 n=1 Tax=Malus sylvestris TaxID=3752 RepID=UPI0021ABDF48|nr:uncharacterized protein LOC126631861 isoform X1 [Malus sylvestris]
MADKPSRALVLYGDGSARFVDPSHTHLHSLASKASCGFLSLPIAPPSESEGERIVREFAVLLDAYEEERGKKSVIPISERFMGMKAAIFTNNSSLKSFGTKLGLSVFQIDGFLKNSPAGAEQPVDFGASELLQLLGFQEGKAAESSQYDLVFVHVGAGEVEYLNALVGGISQIDQPGSEVSSRLHLSVVLSYGKVSENEDTNLSVSIRRDDENSNLSKLVPRQSYTVKGENPREDVSILCVNRDHCPMLIAQRQYAVTRKDMAETFSFKDFKERGGNLVIPADRFLHEVAFKLWKAPKYGA